MTDLEELRAQRRELERCIWWNTWVIFPAIVLSALGMLVIGAWRAWR